MADKYWFNTETHEVEEVETGTRVVVTESGEPGWNAIYALRSLAHAYA